MPLLRSRSLPRLVRWICPGPTGLALALALGRLSAGDAAAAAQAGPKWPTQAGLTWPDTAVDVSRYQTVEECLAAAERVIEVEAKRERITTRIWRDTMPYNPRAEGPSQPAPAAVTTTAARCMARFKDPTELVGGNYNHDEDALAKFWYLRYVMRMYLLANRDADATAFLAQRIAAKPASRRALEGVAIEAYEDALPMRTAALESLYLSWLHDSLPPRQRYNLYDALWGMATSVGDTTRAKAYGAQLMAVWPQLAPDRRQALLAPEDLKPMIGQRAFNPLTKFHHQALLDTLRQHGTTRYVAARAALFTQLAGMAPAGVVKFSKLDEFHTLVGQRAPAIIGDFWYRRGDSTAARPTRGQVGLVVFIDATPPGMVGASPGTTDSAATFTSCFPHRNSREELEADYRRRMDELHEKPPCWEIPAVLRRLAQRFPALEITVVTQTYGSFVYTAYSKESVKEVEQIRKWLHDVHRTPGALAVTTTSHGYRPEPDGRIAHRLTAPNTANYFSAVGETWSWKYRILGQEQYTPVTPHGAAFVVDHEGTIATALQITRTKEAELAEVVDVLLQRSGPPRAPARP